VEVLEMLARRISPLLGVACFFSAACSGSSNPGVAGPAPGPGGDSSTPPGETPAGDDQSPHALGTIVLGESHFSGSSAVSPIVSVSFVPDAAAVKKCASTVAGCELQAVPKCANSCGADEVCALDQATCAPKCQKVCRSASCKKAESFDAGPIAFSGTTTAITLFPPYTFEADLKGAPFLNGAEIRVQASGAANAGFEKFDEKFTATELLQTSPPLSDLTTSAVFGTGPLPVSWVAGKDRVVVSLAGEGGVVECKADDEAGRLDVAREAVRAAIGGGTSVAVSVRRERTQVSKGHKTRGTLSAGVVQPAGWLELTTRSVETASFACSGAECTSGQSCNECTQQGACKAEYDACAADATCPALSACLDACSDSACRSACFTKYPDPGARSKNGALFRCQCTTGCAAQCAAECK
jgi:hypothetical protein